MKKRVWIIAACVVVIMIAGFLTAAYLLRGNAARARHVTDLSMGEKYLAELNYEQATATLQHVIDVEPNNTEAYLALAKAYHYMGDVDTAQETLELGYSRTNSSVIQREISALPVPSEAGTDSAVLTGVTTVEIGGRVYSSDITELILRESGLTNADLDQLTAFTNLERLDISGNEISDISTIANLKTLKKFYAANNEITDVSPLAELPALEYLGLRGNKIADADLLFGISSLKYLHLANNQITAVSQIGTGLQLLYLEGNQISDPSVVENADLLYYDIGSNPGM